MILCGVASAQDGWTAKWIAAPWSTIRDGAEVDGSKAHAYLPANL